MIKEIHNINVFILYLKINKTKFQLFEHGTAIEEKDDAKVK